MPKFAKGDRVRVVNHRESKFYGVEGVISDTHPVFGGSGPVTPATGLPQSNGQVRYDIEIDPYPHHLTYLHEEWLEPLPSTSGDGMATERPDEEPIRESPMWPGSRPVPNPSTQPSEPPSSPPSSPRRE